MIIWTWTTCLIFSGIIWSSDHVEIVPYNIWVPSFMICMCLLKLVNNSNIITKISTIHESREQTRDFISFNLQTDRTGSFWGEEEQKRRGKIITKKQEKNPRRTMVIPTGFPTRHLYLLGTAATWESNRPTRC